MLVAQKFLLCHNCVEKYKEMQETVNKGLPSATLNYLANIEAADNSEQKESLAIVRTTSIISNIWEYYPNFDPLKDLTKFHFKNFGYILLANLAVERFENTYLSEDKKKITNFILLSCQLIAIATIALKTLEDFVGLTAAFVLNYITEFCAQGLSTSLTQTYIPISVHLINIIANPTGLAALYYSYKIMKELYPDTQEQESLNNNT